MPRIVFVHGYTGSPEHFGPLAEALEARYGEDLLTLVRLPGHGTNNAPAFDRQAFVDSVTEAIDPDGKEERPLVIIGHSTGGILAIAALRDLSVTPDLLILAAVPKQINSSYLDRWASYRAGAAAIPFSSMAKMVSFINTVGKCRCDGSFPVVALHGEQDELVPPARAYDWEKEAFGGPVRTVLVPSAGHDLFRGRNGSLATDLVVRAISDLVDLPDRDDEERMGALVAIEPAFQPFIDRFPMARRHIAQCPSGFSVGDKKPALAIHAATEPVFANIEITTRCNLGCRYCARTLYGRRQTDMTREMFSSLLGMLPHAYRVTLVGLGEPLLHPDVVALVAEASSRGRRVALVTNGMTLDACLSRELLGAGLESIAFSIDGGTQEIASEVRPGTDLNRVTANIKTFVDLSKTMGPISTAVFSAVSVATVGRIEELVDVVAGLGVHVMMLTDLNFRENQDYTLWKNADDRISTIVRNTVARAFKKNLPILSVRGLEEFGLSKRYGKFLLLPPDQLYHRSETQSNCFSPWQTLPVSVSGDVTLCDCQPEVMAGNLFSQPLSEIWNNEVFAEHRRRMLSTAPPEVCKICPRF